jgi:hypothetical protein
VHVIPLSAKAQINAQSGDTAVADDARAELVENLPPNGEAQLTLKVTAPPQPATYLMELDMVQEGVAWFKQRGSETAIFPVIVEEAQSLQGAAEAVKARMEMYGMPLEAVVGIVTHAGARFVEFKQDHCAGSNWRSSLLHYKGRNYERQFT